MNAKNSTQKRYLVTAEHPDRSDVRVTILETDSFAQAAAAWRSYRTGEMLDRRDGILVIPGQTYSVVALSQTSFDRSRQPLIERKCGHEHQSLATAERCRRHLTKGDFEGWVCAAWDRAEVRHSDGSRLSEEEASDLYEIERSR